MKDTYNRKINYLRLSVTDRCNLRCKYCMPSDGIQKKEHDGILRHEEIVEIVKTSAELGIEKIRLTGGEPLVRKDLVSLIKKITNVNGIKEVTLTTNGLLLLEKLKALEAAGLNRINLSLDTLNANKYKEITRGGDISNVLECIKRILKTKMLPLKINVVLIGGFNVDEIEDFVELTRDNPIEVRFIELMPIGEASAWSKDKFVPNDMVLEKVKLEPLEREHYASPARYYQLPGGVGKVGLINPISCSFCSDCNRIRVTSDGKVKPCLHSNDEIDLLEALRSGQPIKPLLEQSILSKPEQHHIGKTDFKPITRNMNRIGG